MEEFISNELNLEISDMLLSRTSCCFLCEENRLERSLEESRAAFTGNIDG